MYDKQCDKRSIRGILKKRMIPRFFKEIQIFVSIISLNIDKFSVYQCMYNNFIYIYIYIFTLLYSNILSGIKQFMA